LEAPARFGTLELDQAAAVRDPVAVERRAAGLAAPEPALP
jgi:hypothetical protein